MMSFLVLLAEQREINFHIFPLGSAPLNGLMLTSPLQILFIFSEPNKFIDMGLVITVA